MQRTHTRRWLRKDPVVYVTAELGVGLLLLILTLLVAHAERLTPRDTVFLAGPALGILLVTAIIHYSPLEKSVYPELLVGTIAGLGLITLLYVGPRLATGRPLLAGVPLFVGLLGIGGFGGLILGITRGQASRAQAQADELETQYNRLLFLHQMLRHNVLNKLMIIQGLADLLATDYDIEDDRLDRLFAQCDEVDDVITNVRLIVQTFMTDTPRHPIDLTRSLHDELDALQATFPHVDLTTDIDADLTVEAGELIRYVFENILHNAVMHNDNSQPTVTVTAEDTTDGIEVTITDNGPGLPEDIREGFTDDSLEANHGVGLYLVNTLMSHYDGTMTFPDTQDGTTVVLTFPAADTPATTW